MKTETVRIGDRTIGPGQPCFIVIEVGTTCLGDLDNALRLIEAGAAAGVDAMKFQVIDPNQLSDTKVQYRFSSGGHEHSANMKAMFSRLQFSLDEWRTIRAACHAQGMLFFATVDYLEGVDLLESLEVPAHKMGAWDITYRPLVEKIAATGKPLFVDLGPGTEAEADELVQWFREAGGKTVLFMHDFHTTDEAQMNMRALVHLHKKYPWPAGFSSPGRDDDLDLLALGMGAHYLEKRLILSRFLKAFHADESLEPEELKAWVARIRRAERALGQEAIRPSDVDRKMSADYYRSICTMRPIAKGELFTPENIDGKRPGAGLPTARLPEFFGRHASRDLAADTLIKPEDAI
ncbi:MAG: N-acetylneuraminate synthase family protein [Hydrogenophilaceae bacterium]|nr:N-acetylneuraminate synthase family protein [Hydrogenophilaceae bacterium]